MVGAMERNKYDTISVQSILCWLSFLISIHSVIHSIIELVKGLFIQCLMNMIEGWLAQAWLY